jgi:hypothetical protein
MHPQELADGTQHVMMLDQSQAAASLPFLDGSRAAGGADVKYFVDNKTKALVLVTLNPSRQVQ